MTELEIALENSPDRLEFVIGRYIKLTKYPNVYRGTCPFHEGGKPSLLIWPKKQVFQCKNPKCIASYEAYYRPLILADFLELIDKIGLQPLEDEKNNKPVNLQTKQINQSQDKTGQAIQMPMFEHKSPRFIQISFSMIETFQLCPLKFKSIYIDKQRIEQTSDYRLIGSSIHNTLKEFFELSPLQRTANTMQEKLSKKWVNLPNKEDNGYWFNWTSNLLSAFCLSEDMSVRIVSLESTFKCYLDGFVLFGRLDRIDQLDEGNYEVIDYKTLKNEPENEDEASELLQSVFLYYGAQGITGYFPSKISYLHVDKGKRISFVPNEDKMQKKMQYIKNLFEELEQREEFPAQINAYCSACKLNGKCPATSS